MDMLWVMANISFFRHRSTFPFNSCTSKSRVKEIRDCWNAKVYISDRVVIRSQPSVTLKHKKRVCCWCHVDAPEASHG